MAAAKLEILTSYISASRQGSNAVPTATPHLEGNGTIVNTVRCNQKSEIQDVGRQTGPALLFSLETEI
jgi:hypothetical protein